MVTRQKQRIVHACEEVVVKSVGGFWFSNAQLYLCHPLLSKKMGHKMEEHAMMIVRQCCQNLATARLFGVARRSLSGHLHSIQVIDP